MIQITPNSSQFTGDSQSQSDSAGLAASGKPPANLSPAKPKPRPRSNSTTTGQARSDRDQQIIDSTDVAGVAESFGLNFSSEHVNAGGWRACLAFDRDESNPSAALNVGAGRNRGKYKDSGGAVDSRAIGFFELLARLRPDLFRDWRASRQHIASTLALPLLADSPRTKSQSRKERKQSPPTLSLEQLRFTADSEGRLTKHYTRTLAKKKNGTKGDFFLRAQPRPAQWPASLSLNSRYSVLAFPAFDPSDWASPVNYALYRSDGDKFAEVKTSRKRIKERKVHTLAGGRDGLIVIGTVGELQAATIVWKCEGLPDAVALAERLPAGHVAVTNILGAGSFPDYFAPAFKGKSVLIAHDADSAGDGGMPQVIRALAGSARAVRRVRVSGGTPEQPIKDLRDHFAAGRSMEELRAIAMAAPDEDLAAASGEGGSQANVPASPEPAGESDDSAFPAGPADPTDDSVEGYTSEPGGIYYQDPSKEEGTPATRLANVTAEIFEDVSLDDGVEVLHFYKLRVSMLDDKTGELRQGAISVPANRFALCDWIAEAAGSSGTIFPGKYHRDHFIAAIRLLSPAVKTITRFSHVGWRWIDGRWRYLSASGAIGADGLDSSVQVSLTGALASYELPSPPAGDELRKAVLAALDIVAIGPHRIMYPLLAAAFRAVLGPCDMSLQVFGDTGIFKSQIIALAQQFFGPRLDAQHLPANWSSTENAIEEAAYRAKDAILVIDDFVPRGSAVSVGKLHDKAERLFRNQGNGAGRQRMRQDGTLRAERPPRGLIISSGEDIPAGQSTRARQFIIEVARGDIKATELTERQQQAAGGLFAGAMAGFVQWLAPKFEQVSRELDSDVRKLRDEIVTDGVDGMHARTPTAVANLNLGLRYLLNFSAQVGAITEARRTELETTGFAAIKAGSQRQVAWHVEDNPVDRFLTLIAEAVASGAAHVTGIDGKRPEYLNPESWGWRQREFETRAGNETEWQSRGVCIGCVTFDNRLYLLPAASYRLASSLSGGTFQLSQSTLSKRLDESGKLCEIDSARQRKVVRKVVAGKRLDYWVLLASAVESDTPTPAAAADVPAATPDPESEDDAPGEEEETF